MILEDYLNISLTRRSNQLHLFKLQLHMLQDLITSEHAIAANKRLKKEAEIKTREPTKMTSRSNSN